MMEKSSGLLSEEDCLIFLSKIEIKYLFFIYRHKDVLTWSRSYGYY